VLIPAPKGDYKLKTIYHEEYETKNRIFPAGTATCPTALFYIYSRIPITSAQTYVDAQHAQHALTKNPVPGVFSIMAGTAINGKLDISYFQS
jgi:hypothetical protein